MVKPTEMSDNEQASATASTADHQMATWMVIGLAVVVITALFGVRLEHQPESTRDYPSRALIPDQEARLMTAPEIDDEYLPCADCHSDRATNAVVRELDDEHDEQELAHGDLWCLHCHDSSRVGSLHLADGTRVDFEDSWRLCTQCHADKLDEWRAGVHGKQTGHWRGAKEYRTCVVCHEPHAPAFRSLTPKPAPERPGPAPSGHAAEHDSEGESDAHS
jgi:hypothetical protein